MKKAYIVAEIGQNHNGDLHIAKELIDCADIAGCDAIKSAKRDLKYELSDEAYHRLYDSPNSFGKTYGEHREFLELSFEEHRTLKRFANNRNMDYFLSVCDEPSLEFALTLNPPLVKVPSKEINNIPLLEKVSACGKPTAFSIGLGTKNEIIKAHDILKPTMVVVTTSVCPTYIDNVNLARIPFIKNSLQPFSIGFSSHCPDPMLGVAAVALGAEYVEYHLTLDREMKGSDHSVSLEVEELADMVENIRNLEIAYGDSSYVDELPYYLKSTRKKLEKHKCEDGVYRI